MNLSEKTKVIRIGNSQITSSDNHNNILTGSIIQASNLKVGRHAFRYDNNSLSTGTFKHTESQEELQIQQYDILVQAKGITKIQELRMGIIIDDNFHENTYVSNNLILIRLNQASSARILFAWLTSHEGLSKLNALITNRAISVKALRKMTIPDFSSTQDTLNPIIDAHFEMQKRLELIQIEQNAYFQSIFSEVMNAE